MEQETVNIRLAVSDENLQMINNFIIARDARKSLILNKILNHPDKNVKKLDLSNMSINTLRMVLNLYSDNEIEYLYTRKELYYVMDKLFPYHKHCSMTKSRMIKHIRFDHEIHNRYVSIVSERMKNEFCKRIRNCESTTE